ncbi:MAG TPA: MFS transporter [Actinoplanes sp.]|nr:MFS transporter [Actinoplanes sp.]
MAVAHGAPVALAEPVVPVRRSWIGLLFAANLGLWMALFTPIQVLLPEQIAEIGVPGKEAALGWVTALGALVAIVVNPLAGAFSDRTRPRLRGRVFGRRHVWTLGGAAVSALSLLFLAEQRSIAGVAVGWAGAQAGVYLAVDTALITQVLPAAVDRAKDLGVINIASAAPQVLGPALAAPLVTHLGGYPTLYAVTAGVTLLGAVLVVRIRSVP